jgi:nucleotide-binding universal stress UspA family protein
MSMTAANRIRSILVGSDLGEDSSGLIQGAIDLAIVSGAALQVIHAHEAVAGRATQNSSAIHRTLDLKRTRLLASLTEVAGYGVALGSARVELGVPAGVILAEAERVRADVIVLGGPGRPGTAQATPGTVSEVLRRTRVSTLILNGPLRLPIERIAVAFDRSPSSRRAAAAAFDWADLLCRGDAAEVALLHIVQPGSRSPQISNLEEELASLGVAGIGADETSRRRLRIRSEVVPPDEIAQTLLRQAAKGGSGLAVLPSPADGVAGLPHLESAIADLLRGARGPALVLPRQRPLKRGPVGHGTRRPRRTSRQVPH